MRFFRKKKEAPPSFVTESGELDVGKLLSANPDMLSRFVHQKEGGDNNSAGGGTQQVALPMTTAIAALRQAQELSASYVPANTQETVQNMALSAQYNLGIEAAHGLAMNPGAAGSTPVPSPFGTRSDEPDMKKKKSKKSKN